MSREKGKAHEIPVPTTSILPTTPPRRFLGSSSYSSPKLIPVYSAPSTLSNFSAGFRQRPTSQKSVTPPKLTRFPTIIVNPVDATNLSEKEGLKSAPITTAAINTLDLPPPPPLTKMPISTRKDRRANNSTRIDVESSEDAEKQSDPPRKRSKAAQKSGESSRSDLTTPRKIIQEIFGPDKSKRPKGKGRKKRRGVTTPKKKILTGEVTTTTAEKEAEVEQESEEKYSAEVEQESEEKYSAEVEENKEDIEESGEIEQQNVTSEEIEGLKVETNEEEEEEVENQVKEEEEDHHQSRENSDHDHSEEEIEESQVGYDIENQDMVHDDTISVSSFVSGVSRRVSKRQAKAVANERLKRLSQSEDGGGKEDTSSEMKEEDDESEVVANNETAAAGVHSRRSTTEGSSKSGSSIAQPDSESSAGDGESCINNSNDLERQRYNPTPYSNISDDDEEDDEGKEEDGADNGSASDDMQEEHKDSDVDSTYSWKPVRAAAAVALEQVTKNQGNGSTGLPGDAEAKAAAAAERRARKINRYKGRNRRTLLFKSSSSKKHTKTPNSRYSAQPTIAPKVFHHGHYFQAGDIVTVEMADGSVVHGQIRGLMMDHFGEVSAGIRFLAPKHPVYAFMDYEPINYAFRYDVPEKLIKIEFVNFVMHLSLDYFDGNPSYSKIEKKSLYTRMGKSLQKSYEINESDLNNDSISDSSSSSSGSEHDKKKTKDEGNQQGRRRHISDSSTDIEEEEDHSKEKSEETQDVEAEDLEKEVPEENPTHITKAELEV